MYVVIRRFDTPGLAEFLNEHQRDILSRINRADGILDFYVMKVGESAVSVTVCDSKAAMGVSTHYAMKWIAENAAELNVAPPEVLEGEVLFSI